MIHLLLSDQQKLAKAKKQVRKYKKRTDLAKIAKMKHEYRRVKWS